MSAEAAQEEDKTIAFSWWNTGLSPSGKPKEDVDLDGLRYIINKLIDEYKSDFIALCEVSERDIEIIRSLIVGSHYRVIEGFDEANGNRSRFSQAYIFNSAKINVKKVKNLIKQRLNRRFKVGQKLTVFTKFSQAPIDIIASHWPSHSHNGDEVREACGSLIRTTLEAQGYDFENLPLMILGDFNSEPFDNALTDSLLCSRDLTLVSKRRQLLYNPYWTELGACKQSGAAGTFYHSSGDTSQWRSFDQIIVSSNIACGVSYSLKIAAKIIRDEVLLNVIKVRSKAQPYDHLPVYTVIEAI